MTPELPTADRRHVDGDLVRRLVARQHPQWAHLPVTPVATSGWDNQTFHLGERMSVRVPISAENARAVEKEQRWLPVLSRHLPVAIPQPLAAGEPDEDFDLPWSVYGWIDGERAGTGTVDDVTAFATALADVLVALGRVDPTGGPRPGVHNWFRGGALARYDAQTRHAIDVLDGQVPRDVVTEVWDLALRASWDGEPVWFHGDVSAGNLLVRDGALAAVIDFGGCGVGDPACDLTIAWTFLSGDGRAAFRDRLGVDPATWDRGRGWALWKALIVAAGAFGADEATVREARRVLDEVLAEHTASR